jgi:hypothetical protein
MNMDEIDRADWMQAKAVPRSGPTRATMRLTTEVQPMAHFADNAGRSNGRGGRAVEPAFRRHVGAERCG